MSRSFAGAVRVFLETSGRMAATVSDVRAYQSNGREWAVVSPIEPGLLDPPTIGGGRYVDPAARAAVAASRLLRPAVPETAPERLACILTANCGAAYSVAQCEMARLAGKRMSPMLFAHAGWNVPTALAAAALGATGFTATLCASPDPGGEALRYAWQILERGRADYVVAGDVSIRSACAPDAENQERFVCECNLWLLAAALD